MRVRGVGRITGMDDMSYRRGSGVRPRHRGGVMRVRRWLPRLDLVGLGGRRWG